MRLFIGVGQYRVFQQSRQCGGDILERICEALEANLLCKKQADQCLGAHTEG